jgi:hypothetical protein
LHQSHEFDKEEFDKEIVTPRPEFPNRAAGGLLFRTRPLFYQLSSGALNGFRAKGGPSSKYSISSLPPGAPRHLALEGLQEPGLSNSAFIRQQIIAGKENYASLSEGKQFSHAHGVRRGGAGQSGGESFLFGIAVTH